MIFVWSIEKPKAHNYPSDLSNFQYFLTPFDRPGRKVYQPRGIRTKSLKKAT